MWVVRDVMAHGRFVFGINQVELERMFYTSFLMDLAKPSRVAF